MDKIVSSIGAGGQTTLIERESRLLTSLLGGHDQSALTDAVSKYTGLNSNVTGSFVGILGPLAMGTVAKQARPLNADAIKSLLAGQKDNIAVVSHAALATCSAARDYLIRSAVQFGPRLMQESGRARCDLGSVSCDQRRATRDRDGVRIVQWLYWLIPAVAVAALLITCSPGRPNRQLNRVLPPHRADREWARRW